MKGKTIYTVDTVLYICPEGPGNGIKLHPIDFAVGHTTMWVDEWPGYQVGDTLLSPLFNGAAIVDSVSVTIDNSAPVGMETQL